MFELASHLSSLVGTSNVVFSTPHRYSAIRMRQIAATFGLDNVIGTPLPWDELVPDKCRLAVVLGNSIIPPVPAFGERCVYQLQFPFFMSDRKVAAGATLLADYDEIWVYSDFVRRNVNGLVRHYGLTAPRVRRHRTTGNVVGCDQRAPLARSYDHFDRRKVLCGGTQQAAGHRDRGLSGVVKSGTQGLELALAGSIHPGPAGRSRFQELRTMAAGPQLQLLPEYRAN